MLEVSSRILQPVGVVHPDSIQDALSQPTQNQSVRIGEHLFSLHSETHERIDVEEPAINEILFRRPPARTSKILALEKVVKPVRVPVRRPAPFVYGIGY